MQRHLLSAAGLFFIASAHGSACINVSAESFALPPDPDIMVVSKFTLLNKGKGLADELWERRVKELEKKPAHTITIREQSDLGGLLALQGHFEQARTVLEAAEEKHPGDYAVASNLGTVYELLGDNEKALIWIKKGIQRNPKSHAGTEWVHVKILEAKLEMEKDPKWLESHTVIGIDYGKEGQPNRLNGKTIARRTLVSGLAYQLRERMQFVKPPDPVVGDLLFSLGNELAGFGSIENALGIYELAAEYETPHSVLLRQRISFCKEMLGIKK